MIGQYSHFQLVIAGQFPAHGVGWQGDNAYDQIKARQVNRPRPPSPQSCATRWRDSSIPDLGAKPLIAQSHLYRVPVTFYAPRLHIRPASP